MDLFLRILLVIALSIPSAILYRLGGASRIDQDKEFPWIPRWFKNIPKKRDAGCGLLIIGGALLMGVQAPFLAWFLTWGLMWASLSSYWDWMFGYDNFYMHGFMIGFSFLPLTIWGTLPLIPLLVRSVAVGLFLGGWSKYVDHVWQPARSDIWSELGRGFLSVVSNILLKLF